MSLDCYHCGEPLPSGVNFHVVVNGQPKQVCCRGCQAVAECILSAGLDDYYRLRSSVADTPSDSNEDFSRYDDPVLIETFSHREEQYWVSRFNIGGLRCAACAWLIEHHLQGIDGVASVTVHLQNAVATVKWNPDCIPVSQLFRHFNTLGYQALPWSAANRDKQIHDEMDGLLRRLGIAGIGMMQAGMVAIGLYAGDFQGIEQSTSTLLRVFSLIVTTPVLLYSAQPFFKNAWRSLRHWHPGMDVPVSIALAAAYLASLLATVRQGEHVYFDTISMFTFFLLLSRYLQLRVSQHQHSQPCLPISARQITLLGSNEFAWTPVQSLEVGDLISIHPGETIPIDGIIRRGQSDIENSAFSGEFIPEQGQPGTAVMAGCGNIDGNIDLEVTATAANSAWTKIDQLLEQAQSNKPLAAQLADRLSSQFVMLVLLVSGLSFAYWHNHDGGSAFLIALSVLVVSCPCALSLATPASYTAAIKALRQNGILLSNGRALEQLKNISHIIFDKTGTLTEGRPHILACHLFGNSNKQEILRIAASLEQLSQHPIAHAFALKQEHALELKNGQVSSGAGVSATINGREYRIGSAKFCRVEAPPISPHLNVYLSGQDGLLAHFELTDEIRPDASALIQTLDNSGLNVEVLSGDHSDQVATVSKILNIKNYHSGYSAAQKLDHVKQLQKQGAVVMMVGDGINDAPVIAAADISVAMTSASELTRAQSDVILLENRLSAIIELFNKAKQSRRILLQNLTWALLYNLISLPLAAMGLVPPWLAALGMSLSSLLVVFNALRISATQAPQPSALDQVQATPSELLPRHGGQHG
ncbi:Copper-exporting P-type ATPase [Zhongshania aliphaticivorans]|uniref:Copper-exporting P-type ATPase n=1 Tax=Zhongshania aliphaticivorans TaxID=1470434 RepID=A0A5S9P4C6_9GAMM|nr:heavy metal translocating P-type ATPase [Zhongshania aliphaticivorans]CAA0090527.1 Copper-exporting P-type ATPase [Zhongshania aliphaticivorans]CAA0097998.1 Copper-exporting P-type ATPase [Zhongshania aliphaticivorans]